MQDLAFSGLVSKYKSVEQPERKRLKKKNRRAHLRTSSGESAGRLSAIFEEKSLMTDPATTTTKLPNMANVPGSRMGDDISDSESGVGSEDELKSLKIGGMSLKERRASWESTLPKNLSIHIPHDDDAVNANAKYTFIESDQTPTKTYEQAENEKRMARAKKSGARSKLPFLS